MNSLITWNPFRETQAMQDRILRAMNIANTRRSDDDRQSLTTSDWAPTVDISEDGNEYLIKAELPEVSKNDVKVTVENGVLTIKGERRFEHEESNKKYHRVERSYGSFTRSFSMPEDAEADKVSAEFKDGLLLVRLPKCEAKKPKAIEIQVN